MSHNTHHKKRKGRWYTSLLKDSLLGIVVLSMIGSGALFLWIASLDIPDLSGFSNRVVTQSTKIYDRTGEVLLYDSGRDVRRTIIQSNEISPYIKNAIISIEDAEFYNHYGVRPLAILRSIYTSITSGTGIFGGGGGSTITQQVIKNALLEHERTLSRKMKEFILAIRLEQVMEKDDILLTYLNEISFGGTLYGVEEASRSFFGKSASDVTLAEAAYLASLPQAPTRYSPYSSEFQDPTLRPTSRLETRKNYVLQRMYEEGYIDKTAYTNALNEYVTFKPYTAASIRAPHFVMYVLNQLSEMYGEDFFNQGYNIITTVDIEAQEAVEKLVLTYALSNDKKYNASNAATIVKNPITGEVLVIVGSRDFFDTDTRVNGQYNVATTRKPGRQPGSSFKPFVYAHAFEKGYTPNTILFDVATQFSATCKLNDFTTSPDGRCYAPQNYDGKFRGPTTVRNALAQSLNIPAVKMLYLAGIQGSIELARAMGITTLTNTDDYGLSLVLGAGEVSLYEMVGAYGVFANEGWYTEPITIQRIEDRHGVTIESFTTKTRQVLERQIALQISDILSDNEARTPLYGSRSPLYFENRDVAAKTGTTNDKRDVWILGYTPNLVVGAWAGNNDNTPMNELSGLIITPLWRAIMDELLPKTDLIFFPEPDPITTDKPILNGIWVSDTTQNTDVSDEDIDNTSSSSTDAGAILQSMFGLHSILQYVTKDDPQGPIPIHPEQDSQYINWEYGVIHWLTELTTQNTHGTLEVDGGTH